MSAARVPEVKSYDLLDSGLILHHKGPSRYVLPNEEYFSDYITRRGYVGSQKFPPGYSGVVYKIEVPLAENPRLAYTFVLKHITNPHAFKHVRREIEILSRVSNKWFAVQLYSAQIMPDGSAFLLFPFYEGRDFATFLEEIEERGHITSAEGEKIKQIYNAMLAGILEIHKLGIIHRDVKLENFYIPDDSKIPPFFLDFGLSGLPTEDLVTAGTRNYVRSSRWGKTRKPTPNNDYFALAKTFEGMDGLVGAERIAALKKNGITNAEARTHALRGGKRQTRRKKRNDM